MLKCRRFKGTDALRGNVLMDTFGLALEGVPLKDVKGLSITEESMSIAEAYSRSSIRKWRRPTLLARVPSDKGPWKPHPKSSR